MNTVHHEFRHWTGLAKANRRQISKLATVLAVLLVFAGLSSRTAVFAQDAPYMESSLEGDYAFVGAYSGDVARLVGTAHFDGRGNLTSGGARVVIEGGTVKSITYTGQYTMNHDGTGKMTLTVFGVATPAPMVTLDFVVSKARSTHGIKIATEIQDALEGPSVVVPGQNSFVTHVFTRRPDGIDNEDRGRR
jgi:hypothetical protein